MTPAKLKNLISGLKIKAKHTNKLEKEEEWYIAPGPWYKHQKQHWLGWLSEYNSPGAYNRKTHTGRTAEFAYNHIMCPPMILWLGEAAGVPSATVVKAIKAFHKAKKVLPVQCAAIRKNIPWVLVEKYLQM